MMEILEKKQLVMAIWLVVVLLVIQSESVTINKSEIMKENISATESNVAGAENSTVPSTGAAAEAMVIVSSYNPTLLMNLSSDVLNADDLDGLDSVITMKPSTNVRAEALDKVVTTVQQALTSGSMMHSSQQVTVESPTETSASSKTTGNIISPAVGRDVPAISAAFTDKVTAGSSLPPTRTGQDVSPTPTAGSSLPPTRTGQDVSPTPTAGSSLPPTRSGQDISPTPEPLFTSSNMSVMSVTSSTNHTDGTGNEENMKPTPMYPFSSTMNTPTSSINTTSKQKDVRHLPLIIVVIILLLLILIFCIVCLAKKKRRSGSTSFHGKKQKKEKDAWAGPVMIPEDNGMPAENTEEGKDGDQTGNHLTLTTFFGKRKSRQSSVLLEDVTVKGDQPSREEEKPLLNQEANGQLTSNKTSNDSPASSTRESSPESEPQPNGHAVTPKELALENKGENASDLPSPTAMPAPETDFPLPPSELEMIPDEAEIVSP